MFQVSINISTAERQQKSLLAVLNTDFYFGLHMPDLIESSLFLFPFYIKRNWTKLFAQGHGILEPRLITALFFCLINEFLKGLGQKLKLQNICKAIACCQFRFNPQHQIVSPQHWQQQLWRILPFPSSIREVQVIVTVVMLSSITSSGSCIKLLAQPTMRTTPKQTKKAEKYMSPCHQQPLSMSGKSLCGPIGASKLQFLSSFYDFYKRILYPEFPVLYNVHTRT